MRALHAVEDVEILRILQSRHYVSLDLTFVFVRFLVINL